MQGDLNWLKERQKGIGGSDVAAILQLNKYKTPYDVYLEKISPEPIITEESIKMKRGKQMEDTIAKMYAEETGATILEVPDIIWSDENPVMFASLDRMIITELGTGILEIKNTTSEVAKDWEDGIPDYYLPQVQHQLFVTKLPFCVFCYLIDGWDLKYYTIYPDPDYIETQNKLLMEFWQFRVIPNIPPPPVSVDDLKKLFPDIKEEKSIEVTKEFVDKLEELANVKEQMDDLETRKSELETSLKLVMLDNSFATYKDKLVATYKQTKPGKSFDAKWFKAEHPEMFKEYQIDNPPQRRFLPKIKG
ncbi:MAG: YqaJ viral recombinase family protein [Actinomycetota bacterium]